MNSADLTRNQLIKHENSWFDMFIAVLTRTFWFNIKTADSTQNPLIQHDIGLFNIKSAEFTLNQLM